MAEPKIRFKKADGSDYPEWEVATVADLFDKVKTKNKEKKVDNVITNSAEFGLISQRDFFDKDIADIDKTDNYTIIKMGDFVYNPRKSSFAPMGPFNCYKLKDDGIVSPLYTCLRPKGIADEEFLLWYFQTDKWHGYVNDNGAQNGARHDRVGMTDKIMMGIPVTVPCLEEQKKIAEFLSSVDEVIATSEDEIASLEKQKKAMMQKIFSQEVRFKKDDGSDYPEWKSKLFSDVFESLQNNTFSRDAMSYDNGIVRNIHYGDVLVKYGSVVDVSNVVVPYIKADENVSKFRNESYLISGDIVIADTAEDETVGKVTEILNDSGVKVLAGLHTIPVRPREEFAKGFLGAYMNSEAYHSQLYKLMQGTKVTSVSKGAIADTFIFVPDIEEQKKIAEFFSDMDDAIASAKQELEKWKELKKGLLQQMFV